MILIFPWRNPWREELQALFLPLSLRRKPALRRSLRPDWLFAVDLPDCAEPEAVEDFLCRAEAGGWKAKEDGHWIQLKPAVFSFPEGMLPSPPEGEAACLDELLCRHPGSADPEAEMLFLIKAREEGEADWESACRELHREFALRLRKGIPLPALSFRASCISKASVQASPAQAVHQCAEPVV